MDRIDVVEEEQHVSGAQPLGEGSGTGTGTGRAASPVDPTRRLQDGRRQRGGRLRPGTTGPGVLPAPRPADDHDARPGPLRTDAGDGVRGEPPLPTPRTRSTAPAHRHRRPPPRQPGPRPRRGHAPPPPAHRSRRPPPPRVGSCPRRPRRPPSPADGSPGGCAGPATPPPGPPEDRARGRGPPPTARCRRPCVSTHPPCSAHSCPSSVGSHRRP